MLSILIPTKNEPYLQRTIEDLKENAVGEIEILTEEDEGLGQRALTNKLARKAKGEWIMKTDAHCSFGYGFDQKILKDMDERTIMAPYMMVLDAENWTVKPEKKSSQFEFGTDFVMQYAEEQPYILSENMCLQGSCWVVSRETYFKWNVCDETLGSWGGQGVELGITAYLNGGRCMTTKETYYAHLFRHTKEDFPYDRGENPGKFATEELIRRHKDNIKGLVSKFNYPRDWKGYTHLDTKVS